MRRVLAALPLLAICSGAFAAPVKAADAVVALPRPTVDTIDGIVRFEMTRQGAIGASIAVGRNRNIVYARGYGYADTAKKRPVDTTTAFCIGSITEEFTAALVMLSVQNGKVALDAPVATYLPTIPHAADVTVRQLLNQTSGYMDYLRFPTLATVIYGQNVSLASLVDAATSRGLGFEPGSRLEFSSTNYALLGMIVEAVGAAPYATLLRERIAKPFGLAALSYGRSPARGDASLGCAPQSRSSFSNLAASILDGAGAIASDPTTLVRWDNAFFGGQVVNEASRAFLTTSAIAQGAKTKYAAGWLDETMFGHRIVWTGGRLPGFTARSIVLPDDKLQIVIGVYATDFDVRPIVNRVAAFLIGGASNEQKKAFERRSAAGEIPAETKHALELYNSGMSGQSPIGILGNVAHLRALGPVEQISFSQSDHSPDYAYFYYELFLAGCRFKYSVYFYPPGKLAELVVEPDSRLFSLRCYLN